MPSVVLDLTMNLANRTAVHHMGTEIYHISGDRLPVRYWRFFLRRPIDFTRSEWISNTGKAISRLAFKDIASSRSWNWPRRRCAKMIFLEPLFSLKTPIYREDIVVCHDIAPITHPEYYNPGARNSYDQAYKRIAQAGAAMVFVSDFTKNAYLARYPADYRAVTVIPLYLKSSLGTPENSAVRRRPYILMVGVLERRKNYRRALEAFRQSRLSDMGYDLLIVGPRGNMSAELLPHLSRYGNVEHLGFLSDAQVSSLYRAASVLFFPSLVEGFGVPALEAPQLDVLPVVSKGTVLEEIVGPGGILVDPTSIDAMAVALRDAVLMTQASKAARLSRIKEYQRRFSLDRFRQAWATLLESELQVAQ